MKHLEERLRESSSPVPRCPLGADFTARIVDGLEGKPRIPKHRPKWKEYIQMKLHKPAVATAAFIAALTIGGTAFAAVGGISGIRAFFDGQTPMSDGGRVIQVGTQACPRVDAFNITDKNRKDHAIYYVRINPESKLTNQQVVRMVQGACEADAQGELNGKAMSEVANRPENKDKLVGGYVDSVITALSKGSITIRSDIPYYTKNGPDIHTVTQTFPHIDPQAVVIDEGTIKSFDTLRVGDHIAISYRAAGNALSHSATMGPDKIDPNAQIIVVATRLSKVMQEYFNYTKHNSHDFEQVTPCSYTSDGYCDLREYLQHK